MARYLTFMLAAPLASFGTLAAGGRRTGANRPTKSQIVGLIAAALGIGRTQEVQLAALTQSLGYAVRVDNAGISETDYQTAQTPPTTQKRRYTTRAEELAVAKHELHTELSWREFRSGAFLTVCLWQTGTGPATLDQIAQALIEPAFTLFLGRKAHPLMLPCRPQIDEVVSIAAALSARDRQTAEHFADFYKHCGLDIPSRGGPRPVAMVYADSDATLGLPVSRRQEARDLPDSRAKWRFRLRQEVVAAWRDSP